MEVSRPPANRVLTETLGKTYPVYKKNPYSGGDETEHLSLRNSLKFFMRSGTVTLSSRAIRDIVAQKIRPSKPIFLYRGLKWRKRFGLSFEKWMNQMGRKMITIGDRVDLKDIRSTSWSTNICLAAAFASKGDYGIVFKYLAQPSEIMLDTRMLSDRKIFIIVDQGEIILLPGLKEDGEFGGTVIRKVTVEMIVWNRGQRTPSGFLLKKRPVNQYNIWVKELIIP